MKISLHTPLTRDKVEQLKTGDTVLLSGIIYTARDAAHKRLVQDIEKGKQLPFCMQDQIIYYVGPTPAKKGHIIGSCGPTTSGRMDAYTIPLLEKGVRGMIGKGERSDAVIEGIKKYQAVYFAAVGGAGVLLSTHVQSAEVLAYEDLGSEAIYRLEVKDFPVIVVIDRMGHDLYHTEKMKYRR
jgi:fumarate hydratase subunit beta